MASTSKPRNKPRKPLDREAIARRREERFARRKAQIDADIKLDPRLADLFLDRTLWGVPELMNFLNITNYRLVTTLTQNRVLFGLNSSYTSAVLPEMDAPLGKGDERSRPGWEAGLLRWWAWADNRVIWNVDTGQLEVNMFRRSGRPRSIPRPTFKHLGDHADTHPGGAARRITRGVSRKKPNTEQQ